MKPILLAVWLAVIVAPPAFGQREYEEKTYTTCEEIEMEQGVFLFERAVNAYLTGGASERTLAAFVMTEPDIRYWMQQFEWTDEVLSQITPEEFYHKIESWGSEAQSGLMEALKGAERLEVREYQVKYDPTPGLMINRSANLIVYLYQGGKAVGDLQITLVECRGEYKLIQAK